LTDGGKLISTFIATHPFHTLHIAKFAEEYPPSNDLKYFGAPRHLRIMPDLGWTGDIASIGDRVSPDLELIITGGTLRA
jgi:hypothetical protein